MYCYMSTSRSEDVVPLLHSPDPSPNATPIQLYSCSLSLHLLLVRFPTNAFHNLLFSHTSHDEHPDRRTGCAPDPVGPCAARCAALGTSRSTELNQHVGSTGSHRITQPTHTHTVTEAHGPDSRSRPGICHISLPIAASPALTPCPKPVRSRHERTGSHHERPAGRPMQGPHGRANVAAAYSRGALVAVVSLCSQRRARAASGARPPGWSPAPSPW
mmetsp:Transcript_41199/g.102496  ORF Transcript_41199/g.102496 Transcript_41199/m.102496 type:complete len:216 (-) Transcript_41199:961-1608(-)